MRRSRSIVRNGPDSATHTAPGEQNSSFARDIADGVTQRASMRHRASGSAGARVEDVYHDPAEATIRLGAERQAFMAKYPFRLLSLEPGRGRLLWVTSPEWERRRTIRSKGHPPRCRRRPPEVGRPAGIRADRHAASGAGPAWDHGSAQPVFRTHAIAERARPDVLG